MLDFFVSFRWKNSYSTKESIYSLVLSFVIFFFLRFVFIWTASKGCCTSFWGDVCFRYWLRKQNVFRHYCKLYAWWGLSPISCLIFVVRFILSYFRFNKRHKCCECNQKIMIFEDVIFYCLYSTFTETIDCERLLLRCMLRQRVYWIGMQLLLFLSYCAETFELRRVFWTAQRLLNCAGTFELRRLLNCAETFELRDYNTSLETQRKTHSLVEHY